ncbi:MAG: hypothetical protein ACRYGK_03305 [Janthinobacterium lividum]
MPKPAAFQSLLQVAEQTRVLTEGVENPETLRRLAYLCLVVFPHTPATALELQKKTNEEISYDDYAISLMQLQRAFIGRLEIGLQREHENAPFIGPALAHMTKNRGLKEDSWHLRLKDADNFRCLSGQNGIEAQLCFKVLPRYARLLLPALAKACTDPAAFGFASAKTMDQISHAAASQTGFIYLSQNDPMAAATMAELTHHYLIHEIAAQQRLAPAAIDLRLVYGPTVGTQFVRPGVGYLEKNAQARAGRSTGESISDVIAAAIEDSRHGKRLEHALADRLDENGQAENPAFVKRQRPGDLQIEPFIQILQSRTPQDYSASSFRQIRSPSFSEDRTARDRFDYFVTSRSSAE